MLYLTHFMSLISFDTPPFQGVSKEISGMKWANNQYTQGFAQNTLKTRKMIKIRNISTHANIKSFKS